MPKCSKCGKQINESICPHCQTPMPTASLAKSQEVSEGDSSLYEGLTSQESQIFTNYLRLVQGGWLEVAAVDRLGTDNNMELDEIKSIIKRGLKALQKAQEKAQKEAELKARQFAKDAKKSARQAARRAKKEAKARSRPARAGGGSAVNVWRQASRKPWLLWPGLGLLLFLIIVGSVSALRPEAEPPAPVLTEAAPLPPLEKYYLRQGRVACYHQQDISAITQAAANRQQFEQILASGCCFISRAETELQEIQDLSGSLVKGLIPGQGWLYFHNESLRRQTVPRP